MAAYKRAVQEVARGLFAPKVAEQLAACNAWGDLYIPDQDVDHCVPKAYDDVSQAARSLGLGCLSERLLELAVVAEAPSSDSMAAQRAASEEQSQRLKVATSVWHVLSESFRHAQLQLQPELLSSPNLRPALTTALQGLEQCGSRCNIQAFAMLTLERISTKLGMDQRPAWLSSFLPVVVQALEVCTLAGVGIMAYALEVLWQQPELLPPRAVAAVLDRQLYLQRPTTSLKAARLLAMAASERFGTAAMRARIKSTDLSTLVHEAEGAVLGSPWELWHIQFLLSLADHPSFQAHALQWLVPRLVAHIHRHDSISITFQVVDQLPELLQLRPDLAEALVAKGLLPALARFMVASQADPLWPSVVAVVVMRLADQAPSSMGAAVHESQALKAALEYSFGISQLPPFQQLAQWQAQRMASGVRSGIGRSAAEKLALLRQLKHLRICSYAACSRVEDIRGSSLKACAACMERSGAAARGRRTGSRGNNGSSSSRSGSSSSRTGSSSSAAGNGDGSSGRDKAAVYCGRECQVADRFAGHAACLLESLKGVTLASVTAQQRKRLLRLTGCADNAAMLETLQTLRRLFGASTQADTLAGLSSSLQLPMFVEWVAAGLGKQLVACMAALKQRRAWHRSEDSTYIDRTVVTVEALMPVVANVLSVLRVTALAGGGSTAVRNAMGQLQQQLCADGAPWLAFALTEVGDQHAGGRGWWKLLEATGIAAVGLLLLCHEGPYADTAMEASLKSALRQAARQPAVLDAVAECTSYIEGMRAEHGAGGPFFLLIKGLLQEPAQMQQMAEHPAFIKALCRALTLPQLSGAKLAGWKTNADCALKLIAHMALGDQRAADTLAAIEPLLPLVFELLDPPATGRAEDPTPGATSGIRSAFAALWAMTRTETAAAWQVIHETGWLLKHNYAWSGWSPEEREMVHGMMKELARQMMCGRGQGLQGLVEAARAVQL